MDLFEIEGPGDIIEKLIVNHLKQWHIEERIAELCADNQGNHLDELGQLAIDVRRLNNQRLKLRNALNEYFGSGFTERKIGYAGEGDEPR